MSEHDETSSARAERHIKKSLQITAAVVGAKEMGFNTYIFFGLTSSTSSL